MRIGVIGDTHGNLTCIRKVVEQAGPVALWLHTGDHIKDAGSLAVLTGVKVQAVIGNCDPVQAGVPDLFLTIEDQHIMLTHGHRYCVKHGLQELSRWARQYEAKIVIFGHTHKPLIRQEENLLIFNPGSPTCPRENSEASFGIIEIVQGKVYPAIIKLD